jgi:hypothetical protein
MEHDGSGVSALLGLDGFVVVPSCSTRTPTGGGSRSSRPRIAAVPNLWVRAVGHRRRRVKVRD